MNLLENIIETALKIMNEATQDRVLDEDGFIYLALVCWVGLRRISAKLRAKSYYSVWPENQADKFGGVPKR